MNKITLNTTELNNLLTLCKYYKIYPLSKMVNILVYKELRSVSTRQESIKKIQREKINIK